jgi:hypothetical protein
MEVETAGFSAKAAVLRPKAATVANASTSLFMMSSWGDHKQIVPICFITDVIAFPDLS